MIPVILVVMVIGIDSLTFAAAAARFDHVAPQQVLALAASPAKDGYEISSRAAAVQSALAEDFSGHGMSVSVTASDAGAAFASMEGYTCVLTMPPWPLSVGGLPALGASGPAVLRHECALAIDSYTPGAL